MKIIIDITDPTVLEDYKDVHPDIIADDFINNPRCWLENIESIEVFAEAPKFKPCPKCGGRETGFDGIHVWCMNPKCCIKGKKYKKENWESW